MSSKDPIASSPSSIEDALRLTRLQRQPQLDRSTAMILREEILDLLAPSSPSPKRSTTENNEPLDLNVRHHIQVGTPWHVLSQLLWQDYKQNPSHERAARIVEIAFIQGTAPDVLATFQSVINCHDKTFYALLHPKLRDFILENAEPKLLDALYWLIANERTFSKPTDLEQLYLFLQLNAGDDKNAAWMHFKRQESRIVAALETCPHFGLSRDQLLLKLGELALHLGYSEDAREILAKIQRGSPERDTALHLLLRYESSTMDRSKSSYTSRLEATPSWQERLHLIESFCQDCRRFGGFADRNRPALNMILKTPTQWVPKTADAWRAMGDLLIRNRDLAPLLPALYQVFLDNANVYHNAALDHALWAAAYHMQPLHADDAYLHGIAWLHHYISSPTRADATLWHGYKHIQWATQQNPRGLAWSWRELTRSASLHVERNLQLLDLDRKQILAAVRISVDGSASPDEVIQTYLNLSDAPSLEVVNDLAQQVWDKNQYATFIPIATKIISISSPNNDLLAKLWNAATMTEQHDLAWRVGTILSHRHVLPASVVHSWEISGEKRSVYAATPLQSNDYEVALSGIPTTSKKILRALTTLNGCLTDLTLNLKRPGFTPRSLTGASNTIEEAIARALTGSGLILHGKTTFEPSSISNLTDDLNALLNGPEYHPWIFAVRTFLERLSASAWGFQRDHLRDLTANMLPMIGNTATQAVPARIGKWLNSLTPPQRSAWNELSTTIAEENDTNLTISLTKYAIRAATLVYPAHFQALQCLTQLQVSASLIQDLESFVLSDHYSALRQKNQMFSRVMVPKSLAKISISDDK